MFSEARCKTRTALEWTDRWKTRTHSAFYCFICKHFDNHIIMYVVLKARNVRIKNNDFFDQNCCWLVIPKKCIANDSPASVLENGKSLHFKFSSNQSHIFRSLSLQLSSARCSSQSLKHSQFSKNILQIVILFTRRSNSFPETATKLQVNCAFVHKSVNELNTNGALAWC